MKSKRIRIVLLVCVLVVGIAVPATAQLQFDIGLNVPFVLGVQAEDEDFQQVLEYAFVVPDLKVHYMWGSDALRIGVGARAFTLILESLIYPTVTAEVHVNPFVFSAGVGGQAFLLFGLYNDIIFENILIPEVSAAYKVNDWFHLGVGASGIFVSDEEDIFKQTFPYAVYALARFSLGGND